ncbi:MAG: DUF3237 domain-containing protein [Deltaproteobacteria bacterium]
MQNSTHDKEGRPVRFSHEQLTLWYGTEDAPAPLEDAVEARRGVAVTVAVQPPSPRNAVTLQYRVDQGPLQTVRAARLQTATAQGVEYYRAIFPEFCSGERVSYLPILTCSGRRAPDPETSATLGSSFRLGRAPRSGHVPSVAPSEREPEKAGTPTSRLPFELEYLASVKVPLKEPEIIGVTPEGIMVNWYWYPAEGVVAGPKLNAKVRQLGGDWMTIRRDGVGVMDVRATLETHDGALIFVSYLGYYELGENGYQEFLDRRWPTRAPTRTTPRFHASDARYQWLNRVQCVGIGEVRMRDLAYAYDLYAVR